MNFVLKKLRFENVENLLFQITGYGCFFENE
jgi:hypothetical protein